LRRLPNEELYYLNCSKNIIQVIKGEGWGMEHVWETGKVHTEIWLESPRERDNLEDLGILVVIMLKCITKKQDGGHGLD
jgi:hypothetical protein